MSEIASLLSDILSYSPVEKGEIRPDSPLVRPSKNGVDRASSPNSPNSPHLPCKLNSPVEKGENLFSSDLEKIQARVISIDEPDEDHLMTYYLRQAEGEFSVKLGQAVDNSMGVELISKKAAIKAISQWLVSGGRPPQDRLFKLIIEKCERDPQARDDFFRYALAAKAKRECIANERIVPLKEHDDRVRCGGCRHLSGGHCKEWRQTNPGNAKYKPMQNVLRRCGAFQSKEER